jgi:hypothetical protein
MSGYHPKTMFWDIVYVFHSSFYLLHFHVLPSLMKDIECVIKKLGND